MPVLGKAGAWSLVAEGRPDEDGWISEILPTEVGEGQKGIQVNLRLGNISPEKLRHSLLSGTPGPLSPFCDAARRD